MSHFEIFQKQTKMFEPNPCVPWLAELHSPLNHGARANNRFCQYFVNICSELLRTDPVRLGLKRTEQRQHCSNQKVEHEYENEACL